MINVQKFLKKPFNNTERVQKSHPVSRIAEAGWTLVELAVVLVIIGLLTGGMLRGDELWRQAKVRRLMSDMSGVTAAIKGFQDRYASIPGDFPLADRRLANCIAASYCRNGNGDSHVGRTGGWGSGWDRDQAGTNSMTGPYFYDETTQFWKHLALAGFIKNVNPQANPINPQWYQTHPGTVIGGGFTIFTDTITAGSSITIRFQNDPMYGGPGTAGAVDPPLQRPFTVKQAKFLDEKYDDGKAAAGYIWGIPYSGPGYDPACRLGAGGAYNFAMADQRLCQQHFVLH